MPGASGAYLRALAAAGVPIIGTPDGGRAGRDRRRRRDQRPRRRRHAATATGATTASTAGPAPTAWRAAPATTSTSSTTPATGWWRRRAAATTSCARASTGRWGRTSRTCGCMGRRSSASATALDNLLTGNGNGNRLRRFGAGNDRLVGLNGDDTALRRRRRRHFLRGGRRNRRHCHGMTRIQVPDDGADMICGEARERTPSSSRTGGRMTAAGSKLWSVNHGVGRRPSVPGSSTIPSRGMSRDLLCSIENIRTGDCRRHDHGAPERTTSSSAAAGTTP